MIPLGEGPVGVAVAARLPVGTRFSDRVSTTRDVSGEPKNRGLSWWATCMATSQRGDQEKATSIAGGCNDQTRGGRHMRSWAQPLGTTERGGERERELRRFVQAEACRGCACLMAEAKKQDGAHEPECKHVPYAQMTLL